jgi:hypothetical protein
VTIGSDGQYTFVIHTRNSDGSITKALMAEDGHRLATRYSERITPDLTADIERVLGDQIPDHNALLDDLYKAIHGILINIRVPSKPA